MPIFHYKLYFKLKAIYIYPNPHHTVTLTTLTLWGLYGAWPFMWSSNLLRQTAPSASVDTEPSTLYFSPSHATGGVFKLHVIAAFCVPKSVFRHLGLASHYCPPFFTACYSCLVTHPPGQIQGQAQLEWLGGVLWYFKDKQGQRQGCLPLNLSYGAKSQ